MSFWRLNWGRLAVFGVLIVAIVVGIIVGGGTGTTITAIAAALFALTLFAAGGGLGVAERDRLGGNLSRRGLEEEEREREKPRE